MSNQSTLQTAIRAVTGTTGATNEDWLSLFAADAVTTGSFNERMLSWLNTKLAVTHTSLPAAQLDFASTRIVGKWQDVTALDAVAPLSGAVSVAVSTAGNLAIA